MLAVFDIDGVVADVRHRLHHIEGRHRSWERFFDAAGADPLLAQGEALVRDLARRHEIVWLTGRPARIRKATESWLSSHVLPGSEVHMRGNGDHRPAPVFKLDVLAGLAARGIAAVVDDDHDVVQAATRHGYPAVLADWVPRGRAFRIAQDRDGRT